jgi:hypothetical protein
MPTSSVLAHPHEPHVQTTNKYEAFDASSYVMAVQSLTVVRARLWFDAAIPDGPVQWHIVHSNSVREAAFTMDSLFVVSYSTAALKILIYNKVRVASIDWDSAGVDPYVI